MEVIRASPLFEILNLEKECFIPKGKEKGN